MTTKPNQTAERELYCLSCGSMLRTSASGCGRWYCSECHSVWESEDLERGDSATGEESGPTEKSGNGLCRELKELDDEKKLLLDRISKLATESGQVVDALTGEARELPASYHSIAVAVAKVRVLLRDVTMERDQLLERVRSAEAETTRIGRELLRLREQPTLRDQLAMAALHGLVSTLQYHPDCGLPCHRGALTDDAYKIADAALKARNQPPADPK